MKAIRITLTALALAGFILFMSIPSTIDNLFFA